MNYSKLFVTFFALPLIFVVSISYMEFHTLNAMFHNPMLLLATIILVLVSFTGGNNKTIGHIWAEGNQHEIVYIFILAPLLIVVCVGYIEFHAFDMMFQNPRLAIALFFLVTLYFFTGRDNQGKNLGQIWKECTQN